MNNYCVYKHTAPSGKVYIGITCRDPKKRFCNGNGYKKNPHFWSAIQKYGWENISHEILKSGLTKEQAEQEEKRLISLYDATDTSKGYNMTFGGETGAKFTPEVRQSISIALKNYYKSDEAHKRNSDVKRGTRHSPETRLKMSETHKRVVTQEFRESVRQRMLGNSFAKGKPHKITEETKRKISEKKKGKHFGSNGPTPRSIVCVETQVVYKGGAREIANKIGCHPITILNACSGRRKTALGYHWQYAN